MSSVADRPNSASKSERSGRAGLRPYEAYGPLPVAVVIWDETARLVYVNHAAEELFGETAELIRGRMAGELLRPDPADGPPSATELPTAQALVRSGRLILAQADGEHRWVEARTVPLHGASRREIQSLTAIIDRTAATRIDEELRDERALLQTLMDSMPDLIYTKDRASRFTRANRAHAVHGGFADPSDLIGKTDFDLYPREFAQIIFDEEQSAMCTGQPIVDRIEDQTAQFGRPLWIQSTKAPIVRAGQVVGLVGIARDITQLQLVQERLSHQALHDMLTGLPNRALLLDRLEQAVLTAQRERSSFALCLLDLDRFKEVNDTLGHQRGDRLLQEVATRIYGVLRESDTVARLGGDEFAIILPGAAGDFAAGTAQRIRQVLEQPLDLDGHHPDVAASIGIAYYPLHAADAATLLVYADVAMYVAKGAGCGYAVYDADVDQHSPDHLALPQEFRQALAGNGLFLQYQPLVELEGGHVTAVEALLRWNHPRHGLIPPARILPLAERIGVLDALTQWVLHTALRQCRAWHEGGLALRVAVNISASTLQDGQLPAKVATALAEYGVAAEQLTLEITEEALMTDPAHALAVLNELHGMGVRLAIDDFGTGFSSLAYLKNLPVHTIKIDKSFVLGMAPGLQDDAIVRSVIELSHNLGLAVVAEGIEDQATMSRLADLSCDTGQGFFMSKPVSPGDLEQWMRTSAWSTSGHPAGAG
jgi:diguanylate cyclase (GGDEF)-like protein/PAS domain S-box-containing protein